MKYHTTKKELRENYNHIIGVSYCGCQYLTHYMNANSYCSGIYGWSCDNFDINGVLISTGYNYINGKNAKGYKYEILEKYEKEAEKIVCSSIEWQEKKEKVNSLLNEFINKCIE